jgi:predicted nucleic acid-binding protein
LPEVVSDAGPLIHLAQINKLRLVKKLFNNVVITSKVKKEVYDEGIKLGHSDAQVIGSAVEEGWIIVEDIPRKAALASKRLVEGENISRADAETLLLAKEKKAEILVDEKALSDLARMYGLKTWNTWTVLLESLRRGFIQISDIETAIKELGEKRHKLKNKQAAQILEAAKIIARKRQEETGTR